MIHRTAQTVCVINCMRLVLFDVRLRIIQFAFIAKRLCQRWVSPKSDGRLGMFNGLPSLALGLIDIAGEAMKSRPSILYVDPDPTSPAASS